MFISSFSLASKWFCVLMFVPLLSSAQYQVTKNKKLSRKERKRLRRLKALKSTDTLVLTSEQLANVNKVSSGQKKDIQAHVNKNLSIFFSENGIKKEVPSIASEGVEEQSVEVIKHDKELPLTEFVLDKNIIADTLQVNRSVDPTINETLSISTPSGLEKSPFIDTAPKHTFTPTYNNTQVSLSEIDLQWKEELTKFFYEDQEFLDAIKDQRYLSNSYYSTDLPTEVLRSRLQELDAKTPFDMIYHPSLESVIKGYLKDRIHVMARLKRLSAYYFPLFEEVLDAYDLPLELKYLPIVESALKPKAKSRVGATGLWQFMFQTGKMYGLEVNSYVDERMDPVKSTHAAAKYLKKLYSMFGSWDLVLAAYNSGPGNVNKAIRRSGGHRNYWNIRPFLPRETAGYLPAFLATYYLFEYSKEHGVVPEEPEHIFFTTDTLQVKSKVQLDVVSKELFIQKDVLEFLNPSYKLGIIPASNTLKDSYYLRLPMEQIGNFLARQDHIYSQTKNVLATTEKPLPKFYNLDQKVRYRVRQGDYLGKIASKFGVSVSQIKRWNGLGNSSIREGKTLIIYPKNIKNLSKSTSQKNKKQSSSGFANFLKRGVLGSSYRVESGDSLWSISRKFSVTVDELKQWNNLSGSALKPDMILRVK